jgi:hypothetical protein
MTSECGVLDLRGKRGGHGNGFVTLHLARRTCSCRGSISKYLIKEVW